jgi:ferredoxin--NADP+ reductase
MLSSEIELDPANSCSAVITESRRITPESAVEVRHIVLRIDDPAFRYLEGQVIGVLIPGPHEFGNAYHHRFYSIANARGAMEGDAAIVELLVRRCFYLDEVSGERYPGIASNRLCDALPGDRLQITGPYRSPFTIPADRTCNLVMLGAGTGVAPFRSLIKRIYDQLGGWEGRVRLYYGAKTGMDLLYQNEMDSDLANYYDQASFKAFQAVCKNRFSPTGEALERSLEANAEEVWELIRDPNTYVYVAGLEHVRESLDKVMSRVAGSAEQWQEVKRRLADDSRWSELIYG